MPNIKLSKKAILLIAIIATALMIVYAQFVLGHHSQCFKVDNSINSLGLSMGYSKANALSFLEARSNEQLNCYINFLRKWDSIFPILYTLMYVFWIVFLFKKWKYILIVPILRMLVDWTKNYLEISFTDLYYNHW